MGGVAAPDCGDVDVGVGCDCGVEGGGGGDGLADVVADVGTFGGGCCTCSAPSLVIDWRQLFEGEASVFRLINKFYSNVYVMLQWKRAARVEKRRVKLKMVKVLFVPLQSLWPRVMWWRVQALVVAVAVSVT